jgi:hypothetical protein
MSPWSLKRQFGSNWSTLRFEIEASEIDSGILLEHLDTLRSIGEDALRAEEIDDFNVARTMHAAITEMLSAELDPPLAEEQQNLLKAQQADYQATKDRYLGQQSINLRPNLNS